jgi:hypothetical protein
MRPNALSRRRGHTLVEMMIVLTVMTAVLGGSMLLLESTREAWRLADTESRLQERGRRVLQTVLSELRRTGLTSTGGNNYPAIWERARGPETTPRGNLVATLAYSDASLVNEVYAYQGLGNRIVRNETRISDEAVFQLPADLDLNGTPLDANGDLEWGPELISYRVIEDANGKPWLYRYVEQAGVVIERRIVGPSVASITFDVVFNDRSLRFGEVAVVLYLQETNARGQLISTSVEGSVGMRNTKEL